MRINWKVRFKSYKFWVAVLAFVGLVVNDLGLMDMGQFDKYVNAFLYLLVAGGIVTDPVVAGLSDSKLAMRYDKPKKDSDYIG